MNEQSEQPPKRPTIVEVKGKLIKMQVPELLQLINEHNEEYPKSLIAVVAGAPKITLIGEILKAYERQIATATSTPPLDLDKEKLPKEVAPPGAPPPVPPVLAKPVRKFYETTQGQTHTRAGGLVIRFTPYEMAGGSVMAVYETDKPVEVIELDKLVEAKKIAHITEAQYEQCLKKKSHGSNPFGHTLFDKPFPAKIAPAVAINAEPPAQPAPGSTLASAADAVVVGKV